ncbi:hypothetical protein GC194_14545 [bacterium]|nr:hypothetical protein [bacterium]
MRYINSRYFWAIIIFAVNLLQALGTNLHDDEAYYWLFSKHLDWGYFDHPPMVALLIKASSSVFQGVLGVRFFAVVFITLLWLLINDLVNKKTATPWLAIGFLSLPVFNLYGFITTPDVPLLLFGACYLWLFRRFLNNKPYTWIFLGLCMALLAYSKYHGALIVFFSVFAIRSRKQLMQFVLAGLLALLLVMPHIAWQFQNHWPSLKYHFISRHRGFKWSYVFEYLLGLFAVPSVFFFWFTGKKNEDSSPNFNRLLHLIFWGFVGFFALMLLKGKVEIHWLAFATIPAFILFFNSNLANKKGIKAALVLQLAAIIGIRVWLAGWGDTEMESFKKDQNWAHEIENISQGYPVVFMNSFQKASKYEFYTGIVSWSDNNRFLRKNQFDLWKHDTTLYQQKIYYLNNYKVGAFVTDTVQGAYGGFIRKYLPMQRVEGFLQVYGLHLGKDTMSGTVGMEVHNPYNYPINMNHPQIPQRFYILVVSGGFYKSVRLDIMQDISVIPAQSHVFVTGTFSEPIADEISTEELKIFPLLMKGPLYGQILGPAVLKSPDK